MRVLEVHFPDLPTAGADRDPEEVWSSALEARFEALLARLGGTWKRVDCDGWRAVENASSVERGVALDAEALAACGRLSLHAQRHLPFAARARSASLFGSFILFFVAMFLAHDVWKLPFVLQLAAWIVALAIPPLLVLAVERSLRGGSTRALTEDFEVRVRDAASSGDVGLGISGPQ